MSGSGSRSSNPERDGLVAQFMGISGVDAEEAQGWLSECNWDIGAAAEAFSRRQAEDLEEDEDDAAPNEGRTLDSDRASGPTPAASSGAGPSKPARKKFATLGDLGAGATDGDENSDEDQDFFAGGEKSGLAVQNPDELKRRILDKARKNAPRPGGDDPATKRSHFAGTARTLGGDDVPSRVIEDPNASIPQPPERVERRLHFWSNGFSVDDGDLYDTSVPENARTLEMIQSGRAPLSVMGVTHDQPVDVKVENHDGPYVAPKKKYKPFSGGGQRLGSPTPDIARSSPVVSQPAVTPAAATTSSSEQPKIDIDDSQPTINLQIRLGDGSRLVSRFNTSHTIGDVYNFVQASSASTGRAWTLMTTFPTKELTDKTMALGDTAELKKGGTVVQKWT